MFEIFEGVLFYPLPLRVVILREILKRLSIVRYKKRLQYGAVPRTHYGYCIYNAAQLAKKLGYKNISIIEFGVAEGNGLLDIEYHVEEIKKEIDLGIEVYGFDRESGLPKPLDYRDLPYHWKEGFFRMDKEKLQEKLNFSKLVIGDVKETCTSFFASYKPAPIGCVFFDLDYYSSTVDAFKIFDADAGNYMPRVFCYFDDVLGNETELYNEFTGELLAIQNFNIKNPHKKIAKAKYFVTPRSIPAPWHHQIFIFHDFLHPAYKEFVSEEDQQSLSG